MLQPSQPRKTPPIRRAIDTIARRFFFRQQLEFWLQEAEPSWSLAETRARIVEIRQETPDTRTFVLRPNRRWRQHRAGQYVTVDVEVDGARVRRCYSLSSAPGQGLPTITVRRVDRGRVSSWLHERTHVGDTVVLGQPDGDFVVPEDHAEPKLFVGAGSGITPVLAILDDLSHQRRLANTELVYYVRDADHVIGARRIRRLCEDNPELTVRILRDDDPGRSPGFVPEDFAALVPGFGQTDTWLCGPPALMRRVEELYAQNGASKRLRLERFQPPAAVVVADDKVTHEVGLSRAGRAFAVSSRRSLLATLEAAGERPEHGCRMGICQSCRCTKTSGVTQNTLTGELSTEPGETIQLCVSVPRSDVLLDL